MSRMFEIEGKRMQTWNVHVGCNFECEYCNARSLAEGRLKHLPQYRDGFDNPHLVESQLKHRFKPGEWVFVGYMGDIRFAKRDDMDEIWLAMMNSPGARFMFMSKDPFIFEAWQKMWGYEFGSNIYLGTTLETNREELTGPRSRAPMPASRAGQMMTMYHPHTIISVEPIMDFDVEILGGWIRRIQPQIVFVGADNYHHHLPEPHWDKVQALLDILRETVPAVIEKPGLERLREGDKK